MPSTCCAINLPKRFATICVWSNTTSDWSLSLDRQAQRPWHNRAENLSYLRTYGGMQNQIAGNTTYTLGLIILNLVINACLIQSTTNSATNLELNAQYDMPTQHATTHRLKTQTWLRARVLRKVAFLVCFLSST